MSEQSTDDSNLKPRELEVLRYMADGLTNREIAEHLYIGVETVRTYAKQIYAKLEVNGRVQASQKAQALGLLNNETPTSSSTRQHNKDNLPLQVNPFVGRKQELIEIRDLLTQPEVRLLTILAPGGMGKTRLALESASQQISNFADGVFFIPLQSLSHVDHIVLAIVDALDLTLQQVDRDLRLQLLDRLHQKKMLLVIDNWEHLLQGSDLVAEILQTAPDIRIIATSREKLSLSIEHVYPLSGMEFPTWETPEDALEYDAVQLLVQSARRVKTDWVVTETNLDYVARICRLTAGMPLGILLATSWLDMLSLKEIASEIQKNVDFLEANMRDLPERQRSIRAVFEYTWDRLNHDERQLFMKLSVFRGGFTRTAVQTIAEASLRDLYRLVEKALITRGEMDRFSTHELLRQYGAELLHQSDNADDVRHAHSRYFLKLLTDLEADIKGKHQQEALNEIEHDFENIRMAWNQAVEQQDFDLISGSVESLMWYGEMHSRFLEVQALVEQALHHLPDRPEYEVIWSRLTIRRFRLLEQPAPDDTLKRALSIAEQYNNQSDIALCLFVYGRSNWARQQNYRQAMQYFEQAYQVYQTVEDKFYCASLVNRMGLCQVLLGNNERGISLTAESAELQRQLGDLSGLGISLNNLGIFHTLVDNFDSGVQFLHENIELGHQTKNNANLSWSHGMLSLIYIWGGQFIDARRHATIATSMGQEVGYVQSECLGVTAFGLLACIEDEDYKFGLEMCQQGLRLARLSNMALSPNARFGILLAQCGLGRIDGIAEGLQMIFDNPSAANRIPHLGLACAIWSVYCHQIENYQGSIPFLSFVLNASYKTFGWTKRWELLERIQHDLQSRFDETTFNRLWEEGRHLTHDITVQKLLNDIEQQ